MTPIGEYLAQAAISDPEKVALVAGEGRHSYQDLARAADGLTFWLLRQGLRTGDRVGIFLENSKEAVIAICGTLRAGGCIVVLNPTTRRERVRYIVEDSGARFVMTNSARVAGIKESAQEWSTTPVIVAVGPRVEGVHAFDAALATPPGALPALTGDDLAAIIYTSGSTGKPKGVTLTHRSVDGVVDTVVDYLGNHAGDVILCVLQLSFGYGLLQLLATFRTAARLVLEKGVGYPYDLVRRITSERVTGFAGAPTIWAILLQLQGLEHEDFSSLRYITNAAAAMPAPFIPQLQRIFPSTRIFLMHGLTECLRTTYLPPEEIGRRPSSVGRGMRGVELWIEDENGDKITDGRPGELVVRGPNLMRGYWNDPAATAQRIRSSKHAAEPVLYAGDLFRMDSEGYLYFVARMDDVIKSRGEKVSPVEVEDVIYTLAGVLEVRVIGVPDPILGQAVRAEIVLKEGSTLREKDVRGHCLEHLEDYKAPTQVAFVSSLPKTAGGKIRRATKEDGA